MGATMALLALIYTVVLCFSTFTSLDKGAAKFVSFSHYQNLKPLHNIISRNLMSSPLFISPSKVTERKGNFKVLYRGALYTYLHVLFDQYAFEQYVLKMNSSMQ